VGVLTKRCTSRSCSHAFRSCELGFDVLSSIAAYRTFASISIRVAALVVMLQAKQSIIGDGREMP